MKVLTEPLHPAPTGRRQRPACRPPTGQTALLQQHQGCVELVGLPGGPEWPVPGWAEFQAVLTLDEIEPQLSILRNRALRAIARVANPRC